MIPPTCPDCRGPTVARPVRGVVRWACLAPGCPVLDFGPDPPADPPGDRRAGFLEPMSAPPIRQVFSVRPPTVAPGREPEPSGWIQDGDEPFLSGEQPCVESKHGVSYKHGKQETER